MVLIFDTETSGKPKNWKAPVTDLENWPRLVQLAYEFYDNDGNKVSQGEYLIAPREFTISQDSINIHGITNEKALRDGENIDSVLHDFLGVLDQAQYLVAHYMDFDWAVLNAELERLGGRNPMSSKKLICTMKGATSFCAIPGPYGLKWPSLQELHTKLFGAEFGDAHQAANDVAATSKCFWELCRKEIIRPNFVTTTTTELSQKAKILFEEAEKYCISNNLEETYARAKSSAILQLERNFKLISEGANADAEFAILQNLHIDKNLLAPSNGKLTKRQSDFLYIIKKEIVLGHEDNSVFVHEKIKTLDDKIFMLGVLALLIRPDAILMQNLVEKTYFYYLIRYADSLPEGESLYEEKPAMPATQDNYPNLTHTAKQAQIQFNKLIDEFIENFSSDGSARKMLIPDQILELAIAGGRDCETLKVELGINHILFQ